MPRPESRVREAFESWLRQPNIQVIFLVLSLVDAKCPLPLKNKNITTPGDVGHDMTDFRLASKRRVNLVYRIFLRTTEQMCRQPFPSFAE